VGKGPQLSTITEDDVKAAARVLTGWQFTSDTLTTILQIFPVMTQQANNFLHSITAPLFTGRNDANAGITDLNDLINMIFAQTGNCKVIAENCNQWFVYGGVKSQRLLMEAMLQAIMKVVFQR